MPSDVSGRLSPVKADVVIVADIRVGDVAAPCHAAAIKALNNAGYSVALAPVVAATIPADPYMIDPDIKALLKDDTVRRIGPRSHVQCSLAMAFDARLFAGSLERFPKIRARNRIVTIERPLALTGLSAMARDRLKARAETYLGGTVTWCPTSIVAWDGLASVAPHWPVTNEHWASVAPDLSWVKPDAIDRARPAIGRARIARSRPMSKWSDTFLSTQFVALRERGDPRANSILWPQTAPQEFWPDQSLSIADFFSKIDLIANSDIAEEDPLPVEVLLALSAGVVPCLPENYREVFGGAAVYGTDAELVRAAMDLKMDPDLISAVQETGSVLLREVFAPELFVNRVREVAGPPVIARFAPAVHAKPPAKVMFYSSNGIGMGHLTRQLAVARRLPERLSPVFLSHSRAVDAVRQFGFVGEHLPYHATYGQSRSHWNVALSEALSAAFAFYRPEVLVFDGNVPFKGLQAALDRWPDLTSVWIRRAMWGPGRDLDALDRASSFDLVVEPLDPAWSRDVGPTVERLSEVRQVPPVRILDLAELPDRQIACAELGLNCLATNVLLATGSGNNFDMAGVTRQVVDMVAHRSGLGLAIAEWQIADTRLDLPETVARLPGYPFARYLSAFDLAVAAPGYNTFCEHLACALPTIWVPNEHQQMDQQIDRAKYAADNHIGLMVRKSAPFDVSQTLKALLDSSKRAELATRGEVFAREFMTTNGAFEIAQLVSDLAGSSVTRE